MLAYRGYLAAAGAQGLLPVSLARPYDEFMRRALCNVAVPQGALDVLKRSQQARLQLDELQKKMVESLNNFALARGLDESAFMALLGAGCGDTSFEGTYARHLWQLASKIQSAINRLSDSEMEFKAARQAIADVADIAENFSATPPQADATGFWLTNVFYECGPTGQPINPHYYSFHVEAAGSLTVLGLTPGFGGSMSYWVRIEGVGYYTYSGRMYCDADTVAGYQWLVQPGLPNFQMLTLGDAIQRAQVRYVQALTELEGVFEDMDEVLPRWTQTESAIGRAKQAQWELPFNLSFGSVGLRSFESWDNDFSSDPQGTFDEIEQGFQQGTIDWVRAHLDPTGLGEDFRETGGRLGTLWTKGYGMNRARKYLKRKGAPGERFVEITKRHGLYVAVQDFAGFGGFREGVTREDLVTGEPLSVREASARFTGSSYNTAVLIVMTHCGPRATPRSGVPGLADIETNILYRDAAIRALNTNRFLELNRRYLGTTGTRAQQWHIVLRKLDNGLVEIKRWERPGDGSSDPVKVGTWKVRYSDHADFFDQLDWKGDKYYAGGNYDGK